MIANIYQNVFLISINITLPHCPVATLWLWRVLMTESKRCSSFLAERVGGSSLKLAQLWGLESDQRKYYSRKERWQCCPEQPSWFWDVFIILSPELIEEYYGQPPKFGPGKPPPRGLLHSLASNVQIKIQIQLQMNINEYKYKYIYKKEATKQRAPAYLPLICYIVHSIPVCIYFVYVFVFVFHKVYFWDWPCWRVLVPLGSNPCSQKRLYLLDLSLKTRQEKYTRVLSWTFSFRHKIGAKLLNLLVDLYEQGTSSIGWRTVSIQDATITLDREREIFCFINNS